MRAIQARLLPLALALAACSASAATILWDQRDADSAVALTAQNFEASFDRYDSQAADDFVVPAGETWVVEKIEVLGSHFGGGVGPIRSMHVTLHRNRDERPGRPGRVLRDFTEARADFTQCEGCGTYLVYLPEPVKLKPGRHWLALQANQDYYPGGGQWGWETSKVRHGRPAVWRNPGDGFGTGCVGYQRQLHCFGAIDQGPDYMFALYGKRKQGDVMRPTAPIR